MAEAVQAVSVRVTDYQGRPVSNARVLVVEKSAGVVVHDGLTSDKGYLTVGLTRFVDSSQKGTLLATVIKDGYVPARGLLVTKSTSDANITGEYQDFILYRVPRKRFEPFAPILR